MANEIGQVRFNAGVATSMTIRGLMDRLHSCRNPYGTNNYNGYLEPNYLTYISDLNSLWCELEPKARKDEREALEKIKKTCDLSLTYKKPFKQDKDGNQIPNHENIAKFVLVTSKFEKLIRALIERVGIANPNQEEDDGSL